MLQASESELECLLLEKALTPPAIAGAAGALVHLGRAAKANLHKFSQLGGGKLLTRVMVDCTSDAALLQMLHLVHGYGVHQGARLHPVGDGGRIAALHRQIDRVRVHGVGAQRVEEGLGDACRLCLRIYFSKC